MRREQDRSAIMDLTPGKPKVADFHPCQEQGLPGWQDLFMDEINRVNRRQLLAGLIFLCLGVIEYLAGRPAGSAYFLEKLSAFLPSFSVIHHPFGKLGGFAPDFCHPLGFSLISMAFFSGRSSRINLCLLWFAIDSVFEIAQKFGKVLAEYVPGWFNHIPVLDNLASYLRKGTFDVYDLIAIVLGSAMAFVTGELLAGKGK
jgi:hypothetical protein